MCLHYTQLHIHTQVYICYMHKILTRVSTFTHAYRVTDSYTNIHTIAYTQAHMHTTSTETTGKSMLPFPKQTAAVTMVMLGARQQTLILQYVYQS